MFEIIFYTYTETAFKDFPNDFYIFNVQDLNNIPKTVNSCVNNKPGSSKDFITVASQPF